QENFNRGTRPISATPIAGSVEPPPSAEVVPIVSPFSQQEPPRVPPSSNRVPGPREPQQREIPPANIRPSAASGIREPQPKETLPREPESGFPFRRTEPIAQYTPQNIPQQNIPPQNIPQQNILQQNIPPKNIPPQNIPQQQSTPRQAYQPPSAPPPPQNAPWPTPQPPPQPGIINAQNPGVSNISDQSTQPFPARQTTPQPLQRSQTGQSQTGQVPINQPQTGYSGNTRPAQPRVPQQPSPGAPVRSSSAISPTVGSLSFTVPDQGDFLARLFDGLKNIGEIFRGGGGKIGRSGAGDLQFLLPEESLATRIGRELSNAAQEFGRDPKRFMVELIRGEG